MSRFEVNRVELLPRAHRVPGAMYLSRPQTSNDPIEAKADYLGSSREKFANEDLHSFQARVVAGICAIHLVRMLGPIRLSAQFLQYIAHHIHLCAEAGPIP